MTKQKHYQGVSPRGQREQRAYHQHIAGVHAAVGQDMERVVYHAPMNRALRRKMKAQERKGK